MLLSQCVEQSKTHDNFKKLQEKAEEMITNHVYSNLENMSPEAKTRFQTFLAVYLSQIDGGKDLKLTEPLLLRMTKYGNQA